VILLAAKEMTPEERELLEREMAAEIPKAEDLEYRLRKVLASLFPLQEKQEPEEEAE
jgi:hypothetical protein